MKLRINNNSYWIFWYFLSNILLLSYSNFSLRLPTRNP